MKPLILKLKGLNSFVEEQTIDFTKLSKCGLFGIFGPTGSGKSTILDGMILALYGNRAISRGTNDFVNKSVKSAKISFEFELSGKSVRRYRVEREFKSGDKGIRTGKCRLLELTLGEQLLEETVKGVDTACTEIMGLNAADFMRTVVLPQGKFSEFLTASGKDRREILERLFGLEKYGRDLEIKIAEQLKDWQGRLDKLSGEASAYEQDSEAVLHQTEQEYSAAEVESERLIQEWKDSQEAFGSAQETLNLVKEFTKWENLWKELDGVSGQIAEKEETIQAAKRAGELLPLVNSYEDLSERDKGYALEEQRRKEECECFKKTATQTEDALQQILGKREQEEGGLNKRILDGEEACRIFNALPEKEAEGKALEEEQSSVRRRIVKLKKEQDKLRMEEEKANRSAGDAQKQILLLRVTADYREQVEQGQQKEEELRRWQEELEEWKSQEKELWEELTVQRKEEERKAVCILSLEQEAGEIQECISRLALDSRNLQIAGLQRELVRGTPCPVCGSVHHKDSGKEEPVSGLEGRLEQGLKNLEEARGKFSEKQSEIQKLTSSRAGLSEGNRLLAKQVEILKEKIDKRNLQVKESREKTEKIKVRSGISDYQKERNKIRRQDQQREMLEGSYAKLLKEAEKAKTSLEECSRKVEEKREEESALQMKLLPVKEKIKEEWNRIKEKIGEGWLPQEFLENQRKDLKELLEECRRRQTDSVSAKEKYQKCFEDYSRLTGEAEGNRQALQKAWKALQKELLVKGFSDLNEVQKAWISQEGLETLEKEIKEYRTNLETFWLKAGAAKEKLAGRFITEEEYLQKEIQVREVHGKLNEQKERIGKLKEQIRAIKGNLEKRKQILVDLEKMERKVALLEDLKSVTRGKRFVEYMAAERLCYIAKSASVRLYEITNGNYEIETSQEGEFVIRDNKNGGVLRSCATLSGGETFVASLALALALSAEIQLKGTAPLELFFLDEGFGTLDENLLDVVMTSLEKVQNEHLTVGLISHVESVKARVPVRLIVEPSKSGEHGSLVELEYC